jgi:hypothetical protein
MVGVNWICDSDVDNQNKWTATNQGKKWIEKFPQGQL